jgi:hypothetical protein
MKLVTLALIVASAIGAAAQSNPTKNPGASTIPGITALPPGPIENIGALNLQIGCPVTFTDVALKRDAHYMPIKQGEATDNSLDFRYKNQSGKQIESISVRVELKVKRNIYDLDAITITRYMTLTGNSGEVLPLKSLLTYGLGSVTLEQVSYVGGDVWTPSTNKNCRYKNPNSSEEIGTLK